MACRPQKVGSKRGAQFGQLGRTADLGEGEGPLGTRGGGERSRKEEVGGGGREGGARRMEERKGTREEGREGGRGEEEERKGIGRVRGRARSVGGEEGERNRSGG